MDDADITSERQATVDAAVEAAIRNKVAAMQKGAPGECTDCGEASPRLVEGICCPCRDRIEAYVKRNGRVQ